MLVDDAPDHSWHLAASEITMSQIAATAMVEAFKFALDHPDESN
tara:strand:+ start:322930 stop:323061 length:132 start_codon:yes stop_codon:yes gene_type:complete